VPCTFRLAIGWESCCCSVEQQGSCIRCLLILLHSLVPWGQGLVVVVVLEIVVGVTSCRVGCVEQWPIRLVLIGFGFLPLWLRPAIGISHYGSSLECVPLDGWIVLPRFGAYLWACCVVLVCWHSLLNLLFSVVAIYVIHCYSDPIVVVHVLTPISELLWPILCWSVLVAGLHSGWLDEFSRMKLWLKLFQDMKDCSLPGLVSIRGRGLLSLHALKPVLRSLIAAGLVSKSFKSMHSSQMFWSPIACAAGSGWAL